MNPVVPWHTANPGDEVTQWQKAVKPSRSNHRTFKDAAHWTLSQHKFVTKSNLKAFTTQLSKLTLPPTLSLELDKVQCTWLCKVMQDGFKEPVAAELMVKSPLTEKQT